MKKKNHHILVTDDDDRILALLQKYLLKHNYLVSAANSVATAKTYIQYFSFDLIILDVMMPGVTGIDFAKFIRQCGYNMPIILLTALSDTKDRVNGLKSGADDYLVKPFNPQELLLRIQNLINLYKRYNEQSNFVHFGTSSYNTQTKQLSKNNALITLSSTEQNLLEIFVKNIGKPLSRSTLSRLMGGLNNRSIDVQIVRLRNKIEDNIKMPQYLKTVRNEGYALYI